MTLSDLNMVNSILSSDRIDVLSLNRWDIRTVYYPEAQVLCAEMPMVLEIAASGAK